ncbi:MAG: M6 family metalloprotease domain-containing protein [Candidatus Heimdallarchaeota archaeon]|nr:MAG: M6 family metalloprotease domain-containing protein [Candidatus Heimdallarchaeota archaeon]
MNRKLMGGILGIILLLLTIKSSVDLIASNWQLKDNNQPQDIPTKISFTETSLNQNNGDNERPYEFMIPQDPSFKPPRASIKSSAPSSKKSAVTTGKIHIAVLLVCFGNLSFSSTHDPAYYTNLIFNHSNPKSVASYYWEVSYGQLNITGEIVGGTFYRSAHSSGYWGEDSLSTSVFPRVDDKNDYIYNLVDEGVQLADPTVNFTKFDIDRDSIVDYLLVVHAGNAQEASGVSTDIWSHRWSVQTTCIVDSVVVKDYTMCAETSPMGTFAHELGHAIGDLPDLYDTDYSSDGIGRWGLMGSGAWNYNETIGSGENPGDTPAHFCAWSKIKMGWLKPTIITAHQSDIVLPAVEISNKSSVLKFFLSNKSHSVTLHEYFLVCFRNQTGFDSALPGSGILIWHIDECNKYEGNDGERRKLVDLEEADADLDPSGILWEQLDYVNQTAPLGVLLSDDDGSITDPWTQGKEFRFTSVPPSDSNDGMWTNVTITVDMTIINKIDVLIAYDPFPWDYTLLLMNRSAPNIEDDEPSIIQHSCSSFSLAWQSNRTMGDWDIYGSQTKDAGKTWNTEVLIANSTFEDYSPSLIYWYPPTYWVRTFTPSKEDKPIPPGSLSTQPPLHYILAFVSDRTGNPDIYITISPDFITWSTPVQITNNSAHDLDPCLIRTPSGDLGLFWASNRTGNFEIYFIEEPWSLSNIVQITNNAVLDRGPSYCFSENNTHLLAFEQKNGPNSSIQLLISTQLTLWPSSSISCTDVIMNSTEPSLIEREDGSLLIAFTQPSISKEEIHEVISSNWTDWSSHLIMGFPKNASSPSLVEARCGALFMAYASYNATQISHVYLIHTTLCYRYGVGIKYPLDTGDSFFNPTRVEQNSDWVFVGEMQLNESNFSPPAETFVTIEVNDTKNTWDTNDDENIDSIQIDAPLPDILYIDETLGVGNFSIPVLQYFGDLPVGTILRFQIKWGYLNVDGDPVNVKSSIYVELLPSQDHIQFEGNIPIETTTDTPLVIQVPVVQGFVSYGVESVTLSLYDTQDIPPAPENPLHSQQIAAKVDSILNTALTPYSQQTHVFTELVKAKGVWTSFLHNLRENTVTKIIATSNGIYPRKSTVLYVEKLRWDNNAPQIVNMGPTQAESFPIYFSAEITDNQGSFNYNIDESTITLSYKVLNSEDSWTDVIYSDSDPNWSKTGNIYNYSLNLSGLETPVYIIYYWSASDLANPSNSATNGNRENPYCIGIYLRETDIYTSTVYDTTRITVPVTVEETPTIATTSSTISSSEPGRTIGFEFIVILGTLGTSIVIYRRRKL